MNLGDNAKSFLIMAAMALALIVWVALFIYIGGARNNVNLWSIMLIGAAVFTYFVVLGIPGGKENGKFTESRIRLAITSCLLVVYVVYFGSIVYTGDTSPDDSITKELLPTLTNLLTVTVSFFFGSTAAVEVASIIKKP